MEIRAELSRRLAEDAYEHPIELGQRLEPDVVSDFANAPAWIQQLGLRIFEADPRNVVGKFQSRRFFEDLAKVENAGAGSLRDGGERERFHFVLQDVRACLLHERRLRVLLFVD